MFCLKTSTPSFYNLPDRLIFITNTSYSNHQTINLEQSKINKDLHKEIEALVVSRGFDKREMQQQIQDYERLSTKRLEVSAE